MKIFLCPIRNSNPLRGNKNHRFLVTLNKFSEFRISFRTLFFTNSKNDIFNHYRAYTIDLINSVTSSKINNFENFLDKSIYFFETGVFSNTFEIYHLFISYHTANFQALQHLLIGNTFAEFVKNLFFEFLRDFFMKDLNYFENCSELLLFRTHFLKIFNVGSSDSIFIKQMISNKIDLQLGSFSGNGLGLFGDYSGGMHTLLYPLGLHSVNVLCSTQ